MYRLFCSLVLVISTFHIFAQQTVGLFQNTAEAYNGYSLIFPLFNENTYLINNCGEVVNQWESDYDPGASAYLLENGNLLRTASIEGSFSVGGKGGRIEMFNWEGDLEWGYDYLSSTFHPHHDISYLPDGNILIIAWEEKTKEEAIAAGRNPSFFGTQNRIWSEKIVELKPIGSNDAEIVWEWHLWDHLIQDFDETKDNYGIVAEHPELLDINYVTNSGVDWIHLNSIDYNESLDQIILSSRVLSEFWIIDHSGSTEEASGHTGGNSGKGGDFLYRWGNPETYQRGTSTDKKLFSQHDVHWIPDGYLNEGEIMIFNNGAGRPSGNYSSVDILMPPIDTDGNYQFDPNIAYGPNILSWTYEATMPESFFASKLSGAQRLPNGNTIICNGGNGQLFEVTSEKEIVWEYICPVNTDGPITQGNSAGGNSPFRVYRYGLDYPAFANKDLLAGEVIELNSTFTDCELFDSTTPIKMVTNDKLKGVRVVKSVFQDNLMIEKLSSDRLDVIIFNLTGQVINHFEMNDPNVSLSTNSWSNGIYFILIHDKKNNFFTDKIIKQ